MGSLVDQTVVVNGIVRPHTKRFVRCLALHSTSYSPNIHSLGYTSNSGYFLYALYFSMYPTFLFVLLKLLSHFSGAEDAKSVNLVPTLPIIPLFCLADLGVALLGLLLDFILRCLMFPFTWTSWRPDSWLVPALSLLKLLNIAGAGAVCFFFVMMDEARGDTIMGSQARLHTRSLYLDHHHTVT